MRHDNISNEQYSTYSIRTSCKIRLRTYLSTRVLYASNWQPGSEPARLLVTRASRRGVVEIFCTTSE